MTDDGGTARPVKAGRTSAEWATFAVSCLVLGTVVVLLLVGLGGDDPPTPEARLHGPVEQVGGSFHVTVEVVNEGDAAASDVQVHTELAVGDDVLESEAVIDFLAADQREEVVAVFPVDPGDGELDVQVVGYTEP